MLLPSSIIFPSLNLAIFFARLATSSSCVTKTIVLDLFDKLHESGITIVLVTHEDEVASRAKKIARFKDGKIIELKIK